MTWVSLIELISVFGGIEGVKWLITFFVHRKQEKRLKKNEADRGVVDTESAIRDMYQEELDHMSELNEKRISELRDDYNTRIADFKSENAELHKQTRELMKEIAELNKQNLELLKDGARKDDIIEDKTLKIREIQELRVEDARRIGKLEKALQFYQGWKCFREFGDEGEKCPRRKPQQSPPLKFDPKEEPNYDAS